VRSNVVSPGAKYSCTQHDLSLIAPAAAKNIALNGANLIKFMSDLGCQAPSQRCYRNQVKKIWQTIMEEWYEDQLLGKSQIKHNKLA
jgi:hypothetical protein